MRDGLYLVQYYMLDSYTQEAPYYNSLSIALRAWWGRFYPLRSSRHTSPAIVIHLLTGRAGNLTPKFSYLHLLFQKKTICTLTVIMMHWLSHLLSPKELAYHAYPCEYSYNHEVP